MEVDAEMEHYNDTHWKKGMRLTYDYNFMMSDFVGDKDGITGSDIDKLSKRAKAVHKDLTARRESGQLPFYDLPYQDTSAIKDLAGEIRKKFDNFVLIGIGGSALGPISLQSALSHPFHNLLARKQRPGTRMFFPDNVDPDHLGGLLDVLDAGRTVFDVVTKSGGTAETMATYLIARGTLMKKLGKKSLADNIVAVTDPAKGNLRKIAGMEGYRSLEVPPGVGGRFSVFTPVGLLPAAAAGIDIDELLAGAAYMDERTRGGDLLNNPAYLFAALQYLADTKKKKKIAVMMSYSQALKDVPDWFRQIWAESLGKKYDLKGKVVHTGQTPVKAIGATDQHSQVQLYMEGPNDKTHTFLRVEKFYSPGIIPSAFTTMDGVGYLGGQSLQTLINAEHTATSTALMKAGRPNGTIIFPEVNAFTVGQALYMLEVATVFSGGLYGINPLDQPGVEEGKLLTYAMMGRGGFERKRTELESITKKSEYTV